MDYFYFGKSDTCRFEGEKPCWIIRQLQKLVCIHWVSVDDPKMPTEEELKRWEEARARHKREAEEREIERMKNREEDMINFCEKHGVTISEYPSLIDAYFVALKSSNP